MRAQGTEAPRSPRAAAVTAFRAAFAAAFAAALAGCGAPGMKAQGAGGMLEGGDASQRDATGAASIAAGVRPDVDYLAVGPRELLGGVEPLLAHRASQGHGVGQLAVEDLYARRPAGASDAEAVAAGIRAVVTKTGGRLRFVLLVGDAPGPGESPTGFTPLPTFYLPKLAYGDPEGGARARPRRRLRADGDPAIAGRLFATDLPYARVGPVVSAGRGPSQPGSPRRLAIGRVPARTQAEAIAFARKAIAYDTTGGEGAWRRRLEVIGGAANFGPIADSLIEGTATWALDNDVPYDYDVRVAFLKLESPYVVPFPFASQRIAADLNAGALIAGYVGHGAPTSFAYIRHGFRYYSIATTEDAEALSIPVGKPFFLSITCSTGEFDLPDGRRSLAEGMIMNPEGPIAVFASSRESHPYPNALLGQAFVETFLQQRAPTIGEGVTLMKRRMREGKIPLAPILFDDDPDELGEEHEGLYNLFGDPATKLRYPAPADIGVSGSGGEAAPGATLTVTVAARSITSGMADLTLETRRSVIRGALVPPDALKRMRDEEVWAAVDKNYATASNKVVWREVVSFAQGRATFTVKAPAEPGEYELKALVMGGQETASGHAPLSVKQAPGPPPSAPTAR